MECRSLHATAGVLESLPLGMSLMQSSCLSESDGAISLEWNVPEAEGILYGAFPLHPSHSVIQGLQEA